MTATLSIVCPDTLGPIKQMYCGCCGGHCLGRQWHNQDIGYGLCWKCADRVREKACYEEQDGTPLTDKDEIMYRLYGTPGVHYNVFPNRVCPTCGFDATNGGESDNGWFGDEKRCGDCKAANRPIPAI